MPKEHTESGRGLTALQNAIALSAVALNPQGFGVRSVRCRFPFLSLQLAGRTNHTHRTRG